MIVQSHSMINISNPKALAEPSEACFYGLVLEGWPEDDMSLDILADLTSLRSVTSIEENRSIWTHFFWPSESVVSAVPSIHLKECIVDNFGLDRLPSKMPNLLRFNFGYFAGVGYNYWETEGISAFPRPLFPPKSCDFRHLWRLCDKMPDIERGHAVPS